MGKQLTHADGKQLQRCKAQLVDPRATEELEKQLQMAEIEKRNLLESAHESRKTIFQLQAEIEVWRDAGLDIPPGLDVKLIALP